MKTVNNADYAAFALRVATGIAFLAHGLMKVFVFTIPGTVGFFESIGFPAVLAYATIIGEVGGGILLLAGVAVRLVSLALIPVLLGAAYVHSGNGWAFSAQGGGWEYPMFWAVVQGAVAALGAGAFALRIPALDNKLGRLA